MNLSRNRRLVPMLIATVLLIVFSIVGGIYLTYMTKETRDTSAAQQEARSIAIENAKKLDPDGKKIVLTSELLSTDYKTYYEGRQSTVDFANKLPLFMFVISIVVGPVYTVCKRTARGKNITVLSFVPALIVVIICVGASFFMSYAVKKSFDNLPKPEKATYKVYSLNVLTKEARRTKKRTGKKTRTTTDYYIFYDSGNGQSVELKVTKSMYEQVGNPGYYYIAGAEENGVEQYYQIYDTNSYMSSAV